MEKVHLSNKSLARVWSVLISASIINLAAIINGFALAYPSPIAINIQEIGLLDVYTFPLFASIYYYASIIGPLITYLLTKYLGRKTLILLSSIPSAIGWILIVTGTSASWLILGRGLTGVSSGMNLAIVPGFIGEIAEAKTRGLVSSLILCFSIIGKSVCYAVGIFLPYTWLAIIPISLQLIMSLGLIFVPYSPVWLIQRGYKVSALNALEYLRGKSYNIDEEYAMIANALELNSNINIRDKLSYFKRPHAIRVIMISIGITMLYQLSGQTLNTSYASIFLKNVTILTPNIVVLLIALLGVVGSCSYCILSDRVGRKFLLCLSLTVIFLSNFSLFVYFYLITFKFPLCTLTNSKTNVTSQTRYGENCGEGAKTNYICTYLSFMPIMSILLANISFTAGLGSVYMTYLGELFPIRIKSLGINMNSMLNRAFGGTIILLFPIYANFAGTYVGFLTLAITIFISIPIVILFVPETKRKTIAELEELFKNTCLHIC